MKNAGENLNLQAFLQRSRDHLLQENTMKNVLYIDEAFVSRRALPPEKRSPYEGETLAPSNAPVGEVRGSDTSTLLRTFLKGVLYLAAILLLPGALIGAPLLWWLGNRAKKSTQPMWKACS
jgi:hypothetical protein